MFSGEKKDDYASWESKMKHKLGPDADFSDSKLATVAIEHVASSRLEGIAHTSVWTRLPEQNGLHMFQTARQLLETLSQFARHNRDISARQESESLEMKEGEDVDTFHFRFQSCAHHIHDTEEDQMYEFGNKLTPALHQKLYLKKFDDTSELVEAARLWERTFLGR